MSVNPLNSPCGQELEAHYQEIKGLQMRDLFARDPSRFDKFSIEAGNLLFDFSKNRTNDTTIELLLKLADQHALSEAIEALFTGETVNCSEQRAALHVALRTPIDSDWSYQQQDVMESVGATLARMQTFSEILRQKRYFGFNGEPITDIVHIGVGGSYFGPHLLIQALSDVVSTDIRFHFITTEDLEAINRLFASLNPSTTLFIIASKSFSTTETLNHAAYAKQWMLQFSEHQSILKHFVAITENQQKAAAFGVPFENIFPIWDWVGGRFSVWSAVSLVAIIALGMDIFREFLAGAHALDQHFRAADFRFNAPVILGLLGVWYTNFFNVETRAIIPYANYLRLLPDYLKQLHMESLGKCVQQNGNPLTIHTGPIVWGGVGPDSQHTFHQMLLQGSRLIPVDFILPVKRGYSAYKTEESVIAGCLAQSKALMQGVNEEETRSLLKAGALSSEEIERLIPHHKIAGNVPSNTILLGDCDAFTLGNLLALYEHKIFVQSVIWGVNPFDQWGVEHGKRLAAEIRQKSKQQDEVFFDSSTKGLLVRIRDYAQ